MNQQKLLVIPSIDIKNGKCVRSVQGIPELDCHEYSDDPVEMAKIWRAENAKMIHVVDFDGAHELSKRNYNVVAEICSSVVIPVEFSGGIRNLELRITIIPIIIMSSIVAIIREIDKLVVIFCTSRTLA